MAAQSYPRPLVRPASVLLMILVAKLMGVAQNHPQVFITVAGPWTYAEDPRDSTRVVLIAPHPDHHLDAQMDPVPDGATDTFLPMGQYWLEIMNRVVPCDVINPQNGETPANVFPLLKIDKSIIQDEIQVPGPRYAISIPKPCYYSTEKIAYSIISDTPITTSPTNAEGKGYTTKMVLHYFVTAMAPAKFTSIPDGGATSNSLVQFTTNKIEIELRSDMLPDGNDPCDAMSANSFNKEIELYTKDPEKFYMWFPRMSSRAGTQLGNKGFYDDICRNQKLFTAAMSEKDKGLASNGLAKIKDVEGYFQRQNPSKSERRTAQRELRDIQKSINQLQANGLKDPYKLVLNDAIQEVDAAKKRIANKETAKENAFTSLLPKTTEAFYFFSAGSADCHGAQTGIDGIIQ